MNGTDGTAAEAADFGAALTHADLERVEAAETGPGEWAVARRVALAVLTRSAGELRQSWADPAMQAGLLHALELADGWREHLRQAQELADAAHARLLLTAAEAARQGRLQ